MTLVPREHQKTALARREHNPVPAAATDLQQQVAEKRALREHIIASIGYLERAATNEAKRNAAHGYSETISALRSMHEVKERYAESEELHREASVLFAEFYKGEVIDNVLSFH
jgi:hypothetical protein